jgi:hypothetical protein
MGAWMLNDKACGAHAARVLSMWFLDPKTRMNPNLEYGQAVRGHNTGRGTGLIDTVGMIQTVQGLWLLERAGMLDARIGRGVRDWFAEFTKWMTTSKKGLDEKKSGNNHSTWWTAQVAAYASLTGDTETLKMAWDHYRTVLVPGEIEPDGSCPREEARTNSLSYSAMNLDAFSVLCRIAATNGVNLWTFRGPKGVGLANIPRPGRSSRSRSSTMTERSSPDWPESAFPIRSCWRHIVRCRAAVRRGRSSWTWW